MDEPLSPAERYYRDHPEEFRPTAAYGLGLWIVALFVAAVVAVAGVAAINGSALAGWFVLAAIGLGIWAASRKRRDR